MSEFHIGQRVTVKEYPYSFAGVAEITKLEDALVKPYGPDDTKPAAWLRWEDGDKRRGAFFVLDELEPAGEVVSHRGKEE